MEGPTTVHYRLFLNDTHMSQFFQLEHGANLRLVYAANLQVKPDDNDISILNRLYHCFNIEHPNSYMNRSLSVADVVTVFRRDDDCKYSDPHSYVVQPVGFSHLDVVILNDCVYAGKTIEAYEITAVQHNSDCVDASCLGCRTADDALKALEAISKKRASQ